MPIIIAGLPDKQLYPSVSAVYGNTEVKIYPLLKLESNMWCEAESLQVGMVYLGPPLDGWTSSSVQSKSDAIESAAAAYHLATDLIEICQQCLRPQTFEAASAKANWLKRGLSKLAAAALQILLCQWTTTHSTPLVISGVFPAAQTLEWNFCQKKIFQVSSIYVLC